LSQIIWRGKNLGLALVCNVVRTWALPLENFISQIGANEIVDCSAACYKTIQKSRQVSTAFYDFHFCGAPKLPGAAISRSGQDLLLPQSTASLRHVSEQHGLAISQNFMVLL